jgi:hypothetical protein
VGYLRYAIYPLIAVVGLFVGASAPAYVGGLYYATTGPHEAEQKYLDQCITHLTLLRDRCNDPDLRGILDYAIRRYNKIGPWDVMFMPLFSGGCVEGKAIGCNWPFCPGITLDTSMLLESPECTSLVIAHEAMHDYWPWFGHGHVTPREERLFRLNFEVCYSKTPRQRGGSYGPR